jgi:xanthine/uracil permease
MIGPVRPNTPAVLRQISIVACLVGLATIVVVLLATWKRTPTPQWMPVLIALVAGYELVQWGQALWLKRARRRP